MPNRASYVNPVPSVQEGAKVVSVLVVGRNALEEVGDAGDRKRALFPRYGKSPWVGGAGLFTKRLRRLSIGSLLGHEVEQVIPIVPLGSQVDHLRLDPALD